MSAEACVVKGCPWRGPSRYGCPMHTRESDEAWERQSRLELTRRPRGLKPKRRL